MEERNGINNSAGGDKGPPGNVVGVSADDIAPREPPVKPEWVPGKIGFVARYLIKIAGCDLHLAKKMPADEQAGMRRVGLSQVFGSTFLFVVTVTALSAGPGFEWWTLPVGFIVTGVVLAFDLKLVGGHWMAQGQAYCRAHGLMPGGGWQDRLKRIGAMACRWTLSGFIAFTLANFVTLKYFESDIVNHWEEQHRRQIRPIVSQVTARYDALEGELKKQLSVLDDRLDSLGHEKQKATETGIATTADIDRQIADHLDHVKKLQADKDVALQAKSIEQGDVIAEKYGVRARTNNTGHPGRGDHYYFADDMSKQHDAEAKSLAVEIDAENKVIDDLRRERAASVALSSEAVHDRLDQVNRRLQTESANREALTAELRQLRNGREQWINAHVADHPGFTPMPHGVLAELEALAAIILSSPLIAGLVFFTKGLIMLLESAGPLAKVLFTAPGMYQMGIALRLNDATEMEMDRRLSWEHWRLATRSRKQEAIDAINARRQRRATESRAREALNKIIEKVPWVH